MASPPIADAQGWVADAEAAAGAPLLDVAQAVPSEPPPPELTAHLAQRVLEPESARYTGITGLPELREALAAHLRADYGGSVDAADIAVTAGCNQAFCVAMTALAEPGDEVIVPLPCYFNHQMWLEAQGIRPVYLPFREDRDGVPDPEDAAERVSDRTRALVLVTPNNPTGVEYPPEVLEDFHALARERGCALVVDETYKDFRSRPGPPHPLLADAGWRETYVQLFSFSKAFSLAGYRVGAVIAGPALRREIVKILDCVAICAPHIGQLAALYGLHALDAWRAERCEALRARLRCFRRSFEAARLDYELIAAGAYFAYLRHPFPDTDATAVARRLARRAGVLCLPGDMFGPAQSGYLRFAFANLESERIPELLDRLAETRR